MFASCLEAVPPRSNIFVNHMQSSLWKYGCLYGYNMPNLFMSFENILVCGRFAKMLESINEPHLYGIIRTAN